MAVKERAVAPIDRASRAVMSLSVFLKEGGGREILVTGQPNNYMAK